MSDTVYLTLEGYKRLKEELEHLKSVERNRVLDKVAEARSHGDLSENAEYEAAKEEQGQLESRIANLERTLSNASILDEKKIKTDKIYILTTAVLKNLADGKKSGIHPRFRTGSRLGTRKNFRPIANRKKPFRKKRWRNSDCENAGRRKTV